MKTGIVFYTILIVLFSLHLNGFAQNAKKCFKAGNGYIELGNYEMAIQQFSKAIELEPNFSKAIEARALAYVEIKENTKAAEDYESLVDISPKEFLLAIKGANLFLREGEYKRSLDLINGAVQYAPENMEIYRIKAKCSYALEDYSEALSSANKLVRLNGSAENFYLRGLINFELNNYSSAELDFIETLKLKPDFVDAQIQIAQIQIKQNKPEDAIISLNNSIAKDAKNIKLYVLRSSLYLQKSDYKLAIEDLTRAIAISPDASTYYQRGEAFFSNKQYTEAINDYTKVIQSEKSNLTAIEHRAVCYQKLNKKSDAARDYNLILSIAGKTENNKELTNRISNNLFELNRETNKPVISIQNEKNEQINSLGIADGIEIVKLKFKISDDSKIVNVSVNKSPLSFDNELISEGQVFEISVKNKTKLEINVADIYQNTSLFICNIIRKSEGQNSNQNLPEIELKAPIVSESGFIYLRSFEPDIYIEGKITGDNFIDSIQINDTPVFFNKLDKNPVFRQKVQISESENLNIFVKDEKGNKIQKKYFFDRSDAELFIDNPMGRTWVVFIENSNYSSFTNLEGPQKEVDLMIKALAKYKIDKIIHKKDLTRTQMNSFFGNELKKLVRENRVNSLLIWYAGHGKLVGQSGFWIPVDSKMDDVSTYYNINTLKTTLKPYLENVTHSLIVTDACETGPSFYMSMRGLSSERNCSDTKVSKSKSSQVFTSSNQEFTDGDSPFSKSFANALLFDNNSCIPIERIVTKVSQDVIKSDKKKPIFGRITGFEDENGTFIFIKK